MKLTLEIEYDPAESTSVGLLLKAKKTFKSAIIVKMTQGKKTIPIAVSEKQYNISYIKKMVCDNENISEIDLIEKSRKAERVRPRKIAMYLSRKFTNESFDFIGERLGGFNHATVMHACRAVEDECYSDKAYRERLDRLIEKIKQGC